MLTKINDINDISDAFEEMKDVATLLRMASQNKNDEIGPKEQNALIFGAALVCEQVCALAEAFDNTTTTPVSGHDPVIPRIRESVHLQKELDALGHSGATSEWVRARNKADDAFQEVLRTVPTTLRGVAMFADYMFIECIDRRADERGKYSSDALHALQAALVEMGLLDTGRPA